MLNRLYGCRVVPSEYWILSLDYITLDHWTCKVLIDLDQQGYTYTITRHEQDAFAHLVRHLESEYSSYKDECESTPQAFLDDFLDVLEDLRLDPMSLELYRRRDV